MMLLYLFAVPALSMFLEKCFESGMIFRRFRLYMLYHWIKNWRKKDRWKRKFIKLFLCIYCYNTWITIISYFIFISHNFLYLPLFIGSSYLILEIFLKTLN